jgi:rapamycin-insensitive companion of mTOR
MISHQSARLYAVRWLHVLLRVHVPFFSSWGLELLSNQLYDQSTNVALEALSVLSEACEEEVRYLFCNLM